MTITVSEAARRIGRTPGTVRRWIREGRLPAVKVGAQYVIDKDDLEPALESADQLPAPERLRRLADRTYLNPGTLARSLRSAAFDQTDPDPATVSALLDLIPGAWERAQEGIADVTAGRVIPLEEL